MLPDDNSDEARKHAEASDVRFYSSLAWAETLAVMARMERQGTLTPEGSNAAYAALTSDRWRPTTISPRWDTVRRLGRSWPLRGADLWHLAAAKRLQEELPTLRLLSFDRRLLSAAHGEGLA